MSDNPNVINEENLPANWEPVESNPIVPGAAQKGAPAPPAPNDMPQFFSGSMPPALQHDTSFVGTEVGSPRIPKYSLMPFGNQASGFTNAAAQSTAIKVVEATPPSSGGGGISSITLDIPNIFTPVTQTVSGPGPVTLDFTLATEPTGTYFKAPTPGLTALTGFFSNNYANPSVATHPTITFTPPSIGWAFYQEVDAGNSNDHPTGWTAWGDASALSISSTSPITATDPTALGNTWCNIVLTFTGTIPTLVGSHTQNLTLTFGAAGSGTGSVTFTPTTGNYLIASIHGATGGGGSIGGVSISDSNGNRYNQVAAASSASVGFEGPA